MAADWLEKQGLVIMDKNFRCRQGEIDLIAKDGKMVVFVEIKARSRKGMGSAIEAVNYKKQRTIRKVALFYLIKRYHSVDIPCRFDVLGFDGGRITWIKNAYEERR